MIKTLIPAGVAALMALSVAAMAQEQTDSPTEGTTETETTGEGETPSSNVLDLGQPADGPALGSRYSKQKFGDWDLACVKTQAETDPCSLLQVMNGPEGNPMAELSLFRIKNAGQAVAGVTVLVPLETLLTEKLAISVDQAPAKLYSYSYCNQIGCVAQIGLTQADVDAMKRGKKATVTIVPAPAPDQKIGLDLSLTGFTAGFNAVDVVEN